MPNSYVDTELGPLLHKKGRQGGIIGVGIMIIALACLVGSNAFIDETLTMRIVAVALFLFMASMGVLIIRVGGRVLYLHENGVVSGDTVLTFAEIEFYCRDNAHISTAGIHTQTNITLVFIPFEITMKPKIRFVWQTGRKGDDQIEQFHDRIVMTIVNRIESQLENEGEASWMNGLTFRRDGLEHTSRNGVRSIVPYGQIAEPEIRARPPFGVEILLRSGDSSEVITKMRVDGPNVVPGLLVLESMCNKNKQ